MAGQAVEHDYTLSDFDYSLPTELIAQHPLPDRGASRLLRVTAAGLQDLRFTDLEALVEPGEVLVFNDTRVIKARLIGRKPSGGKVEVLVERVLAPRRALALVRTSHTPKTGAQFVFGESPAVTAAVCGRHADFFELEFDADIVALLDRIGHVPLPPYIAHADGATDAARYQTVYARSPGAVAAPTAGLNFTEDLLDRLRRKGVRFAYVTLHGGDVKALMLFPNGTVVDLLSFTSTRLAPRPRLLGRPGGRPRPRRVRRGDRRARRRA